MAGIKPLPVSINLKSKSQKQFKQGVGKRFANSFEHSGRLSFVVTTQAHKRKVKLKSPKQWNDKMNLTSQQSQPIAFRVDQSALPLPIIQNQTHSN